METQGAKKERKMGNCCGCAKKSKNEEPDGQLEQVTKTPEPEMDPQWAEKVIKVEDQALIQVDKRFPKKIIEKKRHQLLNETL